MPTPIDKMRGHARLCIALSVLVLQGCDRGGDPCPSPDPGIVCTLIGSGENGYDVDADTRAIPARSAMLSLPLATLTAPDGTVYFSDWNNQRIRKLDADGNVRWVAGTGEFEDSQFRHPSHLIFDRDGENLIVADWHKSRIVSVDVDTGEVTTVAGDGRRQYFGDGGPAVDATLNLPASLAWSPTGDLLFLDQENQVIRGIDDDGQVFRHAGRCIVEHPFDTTMCFDGTEPSRCLDDQDGTPSGQYTCSDPTEGCDWPCSPAYAGDGGPALDLRMAQPFGGSAPPGGRLVFDPAGNLYFADTGNHMIRMIDGDGVVVRLAGQPGTEEEPGRGYSGDGGPAIDARLDSPVGLALGDDGTLYISDTRNHCIRAIDPDGIIDTVLGVCGERGTGGDGVPATEALLNQPYGVEWVDGHLLVADPGNQVIRMVTLP